MKGMPEIARSATFSGINQRVTLDRAWEGSGPLALVIGCNPSTADALQDDPTSRWWNRWFYQAGFRGYTAMNLYPFCTPSPAECRHIVDLAFDGKCWLTYNAITENLHHLKIEARRADKVFVCWGNIAWDTVWIEYVVSEIRREVGPCPDLWCWGTTKSGAPKHPLARGKHRIPPDQTPILWKRGRL